MVICTVPFHPVGQHASIEIPPKELKRERERKRYANMSELVKHEKVLKIQNIRSHNNMLASTPTNIHYWKLKFPCVYLKPSGIYGKTVRKIISDGKPIGIK